MKETKELGEKSIEELLLKYSLPAIMSMFVNSIYNIVDRIFIGKYVGEAALGGLSIAFPVMLFFMAMASLVGIGGASVMSIKLGGKKRQEVKQVFGNMFFLGFVVYLLSVTVFRGSIMKVIALSGANPDVIDYARRYMFIIILGYAFQIGSFIMINVIRVEGRPLVAMISMVFSAFLNIVLDYFFIARAGFGVEGAAYATIIAQFSGFIILMIYFIVIGSSLKPGIRDFIPKFALISKIISLGFSSFITTAGVSITTGMLFGGLSLYGGTAAITSMGAINSIRSIIMMPLLGIRQGIQPIIGYNHGSNNQWRIGRTLRLGYIFSIIYATVPWLIIQIFPATFISWFIDPASPTMPVAVNGLRILLSTLPFLGISFIGLTYFSASDHGVFSTVLGVLRQFVFLVPFIYIFPKFWGLNGVWMAMPLADFLSSVTTFFAIRIERRRIKKNLLCTK